VSNASNAKLTRRLIFISHATPDQNAMTVWLASRLTAAGYAVWNDVEQLMGGDPFWGDIQTALREETIKFLLLVSRTSVTREGVLTELQEAKNLSRTLNDPRFVIPIRVDDLPWAEFPMQVARNNGIDFERDWGTGLSKLFATLEREGVPRTASISDIEQIAAFQERSTAAVTNTPEFGLVSAIPILSLPERVFYSFASAASEKELREVQPEIRVPCAAHGRLLVSFAPHDDLRAAAPKELALEDRFALSRRIFTAGTSKTGPDVSKQTARNYVANMTRQALERFLEDRGLKRMNAATWYVPLNWKEDNRASFKRSDGKATYRFLVGKAKEHTWHFGVSVRVATGDWNIRLVPQVLFSANGGEPYADQKQLRRRHCKLLWNDTWRDRLVAFLSALFEDAPEGPVRLEFGGEAAALVGRELIRVSIPVSYAEASAFVPEEDDEFEEAFSDDGAEDAP
jgi:hypothetical protein